MRGLGGEGWSLRLTARGAKTLKFRQVPEDGSRKGQSLHWVALVVLPVVVILRGYSQFAANRYISSSLSLTSVSFKIFRPMSA